MMILRGEKGDDTGVEVGAETVSVAAGGTEGVGVVITTGTETRTDLESGIGIEMSADIAAVVTKMMRAKGVIWSLTGTVSGSRLRFFTRWLCTHRW